MSTTSLNSMGPGLAVVFVSVFLAAVVDIPRRVALGPTSLLGAITLGLAVCAILLLAAVAINSSFPLFPLGGFIAMGTVVVASIPRSSAALPELIQNLAVIIGFIALLLLTYAACRNQPITRDRIQLAVGVAAGIASMAYLVYSALEGLGTKEFIQARALGPLGCLGISVFVYRGRYGSKENYAIALFILGAVAVGLSRAALVWAVLPWGLLVFTYSGLRRATGIVTAAFAGGAIYLLFTRWAPLAERNITGDLSVTVAGTQVNASGRTRLWEATFRLIDRHPWFGSGVGAAQTEIKRIYPLDGHPHNDYLRVAADYGWTGLALFVFAWTAILGTILRSLPRLDIWARRRAFAALSGTACTLGIMITDNPLVYSYVMFPLAALLGTALGDAVEASGSNR